MIFLFTHPTAALKGHPTKALNATAKMASCEEVETITKTLMVVIMDKPYLIVAQKPRSHGNHGEVHSE